MSCHALAQDKSCVSLKTEGQIEESYTDAQGKPAKRLVPPGKVVPGAEVIWTITATNTCDKAADKAVDRNAAARADGVTAFLRGESFNR